MRLPIRPIAACIALFTGACLSAGRGTFRRAYVDATGQLRVEPSNAAVSAPLKDSSQVGFEQVALSADRRVVGWVGLYPNCCTTYPVPRTLVLLRADGRRRVIANDLPIWQWAFAADGRSVVIRQAPVHGSVPTYYERRDIDTGRLMTTATIDSATQALPDWVRAAMPGAASLPPPGHAR